ncbi:alpha/beta hydrolase [Sphingomonas sp. URHD0057]|uniref:alpha/beta hydrolase n=1 Tax=Sphingomonas sp. URHD0057 TaxID=1380389 RepID=UPI0004903E4F|nr:alpha/beta fold hydrolase [Sphingomonas sp. URHD0057]
MLRTTIVCCLALAASASSVPLAAETPIPTAVIADPPPDPAHIPRMIVAPMPTGGIAIPAMFYTAADSGKHPTMVMFTGMPGAEMNSDLIYAVRRAGWNVVAFHYRGSWGSGGEFSLTHCIEDGAAAVAWLRNPTPDVAPFVDPDRIVLAGHSFGGWLAAYTAAHDPKVMGAAMISAADMAAPPDTPRADLVKYLDGWVHVGGMQLLNAKADDLATEALRDGASWDLSKMTDGLAGHRLLVITANDGLGPSADAVATAVSAKPDARVTKVHFETNHGYNDKRIALAGALVTWLQGLPGPR